MFGKICFINSRKLGTPMACAAITYSWFLTVITCPLTILAIVSHSTAPIEIARNNQLALNGVLTIGTALNIGTGNIARSMQAKKRSILYSVKQGDNLYKIGELFNLEISEIIELNNLASSDLSPGQILKLVISAL